MRREQSHSMLEILRAFRIGCELASNVLLLDFKRCQTISMLTKLGLVGMIH